MKITSLFALIFSLLFLNSFSAVASEDDEKDGKIDVVYRAELNAPYKQRRGTWGGVFGFTTESIIPTKFRSKSGSESYKELFGESSINYGQFELGLKFNFPLGSLTGSLLYGNGGVRQDGQRDGVASGLGHTLNITKKAAQMTLALDGLFDEPYLVPYGSAQFFSIDWTELIDAPTDPDSAKRTGSTSLASGVTVGALIGLNWLMPSEALDARNNSGVENTYLDVFVTQYNASSAEEANFQTDMNYGVGLKVEY